jgi:hypothetical protein
MDKNAPKKLGFIEEWNFYQNNRFLLMAVRAVLDEYAAYLPITLRQLYYRLVAREDLDKTQAEYARLSDVMNIARRLPVERCGLITMDCLRDDGGNVEEPFAYHDPNGFVGNMRAWAKRYRIDRTIDQPSLLIVRCETNGMVPQLARVADPYGIKVASSGGFDSLTEKHALAVEISEAGRPVEVLHIGDMDPSGEHMFANLAADVTAFCTVGPRRLGGNVNFTRLAVTAEQVFDLGLATDTPKATDKRSFEGVLIDGERCTCQAEAIAPDVLADILRDAIESRMDMGAYEATLAREADERAALLRRLDRL